MLLVGALTATDGSRAAADVPASATGASVAAAVAPGDVVGDGSVRYGSQRNIDGGNWAGVVVRRGTFTSVSASWTEPKVSCTHHNNLMAPWVGIDGWDSNTVQQTGVETSCHNGQARYRGWYEMYPEPPVYYRNTVKAGDKITASVSRVGGRYTLKLTNHTRHWTRTTVRHADADHTSAEIALESPSGRYPKFSTLTFTGASANKRPVTRYPLLRLDASTSTHKQNHTATVTPTGRFTISYKHE
ncbi:hypothetical protein FHX74_000388 [Friedmanniella endophytica]|uniref:Peptidase A4 family protein n=1 Tax=Microlunatus kandeliicorticis TaxID=1759536 RepID=A0A7W3P4C8_9ACTN|nr:hypothetical protein [Microlunatus kandeliicorticis]